MSRRPLDFYETPRHYVAALIGEVNLYGRVYEPCVGAGHISEALRLVTPISKIYTNDIDEDRVADYHEDARTEAAWDIPRLDWAVTNPPFSDELPILEQALVAAPNVAFLARISFLEPTEDREHFLESNPPTQVIYLPRYSFRPNDEGKKATDSVTCCWLVWHSDKQPRRVSVWSRGKSTAYATVRGL